LAGKVRLSLNADFDARFPAETLARVTIEVKGQRFVSDVTAPKGEASHPLSWSELEAKFRAATRFALATDRQDKIIAALDKARAGDFSQLIPSIR